MRTLVLLSCLVFFAPLGAGCSSETSESTPMSDNLEGGHKLGEFEAFTEAVEHLTASHVTAVQSATSMEEVSRLESEYAETAAFLMDEVTTIQGELEGCQMASGMEEHMMGTRGAIDAMVAEMEAHAMHQAANADLPACGAEETAHEALMADAIATCLEHHEAMHDGVTCMGEHMM